MTVDTIVALARGARLGATVHGDGGEVLVRAARSERALAVVRPEGSGVRVCMPSATPRARQLEVRKAFAPNRGEAPRKVHVELSGEAVPDDPATLAWLANVTDTNLFALVS